MWEAGQLTDVTLATEERSFQAHKMLLSACSPYFRQLFLNNPCKRPTVFLKDVPARHMALLLEYMYQGRIAVKHNELAEVLKTASSLKIRGLTTAEEAGDNTEAGTSTSVPPLVLEEDREDKFHQLETSSNVSAVSGVSGTSRRTETGAQGTGGRKSSKPKKLRLSGDTDSSEVTSPRYPAMAKITEDQDITDHEIEEEKELVIDQPVDFSSSNKSNTGPENSKSSLESKYSILGSYLKAGKGGEKLNKSATELSETMRLAGLSSGWMNGLGGLTQPRPASRDSRGYSKEDEDDTLEAGDREYPQLSLSETMGLGDIAERLRANFLSNLPTLTPGGGSYNWLGQNSLLEKVKREKHNSGPGGIRSESLLIKTGSKIIIQLFLERILWDQTGRRP